MRILPPQIELVIARIKEFWREPGAIFWVYGFPIVLIVGLGLAFPGGGTKAVVDVAAGDEAAWVADALRKDGRFEVEVHPADEARARHRRERVDLVVIVEEDGGLTYVFDPDRSEDQHARTVADDALQRAKGRTDVISAGEETARAPGSRYIDWLLPGLLGMNIMGGGLWGVGFALVDLRVRKLLKKLRATPMKRRDFMLAMLGSRVVFMVPEVLAILLIARLLFGVPMGSDPIALIVVILVGSFAFAGIGLLLAARTERLETVSGLMNLVMMPMWILSGVFFSAERYPEAMQPAVQALPLTQLLNGLRNVMLEGGGLTDVWIPMAVLSAIGAVCFGLAIRWFRWT